MKKLSILAGIVAALLVVAVVALPALVPAERIKAELVAKVKAATGRDLTIDGKVAVSVLPSLSVQVSGAALSNPPGYRAKELVRLGGLDVRLKLLPLLSGQIEIDSFVLREPAITLEVDGNGRGNWVFGDAAAAKAPAAKTEKSEAAGKPGLSDVRLGDVRIVGGKLTYLDDKSGTTETVSAIDLALTLKSLDEPRVAKGGLTWHGQAVTIELDVAKPRALIEGQGSSAGVGIAAAPLKLAFAGTLAAAGVTGALDLSSPSVRELAGWAGGGPEAVDRITSSGRAIQRAAAAILDGLEAAVDADAAAA